MRTLITTSITFLILSSTALAQQDTLSKAERELAGKIAEKIKKEVGTDPNEIQSLNALVSRLQSLATEVKSDWSCDDYKTFIESSTNKTLQDLQLS